MTRTARALVLVLPLLASLLATVSALPARAGTPVLLRDIDDSSPSFPPGNQDSNPDQLTPFQGGVAFTALGEVWASDGTEPGTRMLADVCPGDCSSGSRILGTVNGRLLWLAATGKDQPRRLWRSDGTRAGTFPLTPEDPAPGFFPSAVTGKALYFGSCTEARGCELWRSDGTVAGTRAVKAFTEPFSYDSSGFLGMVAVGERIFFILSQPFLVGYDLWTSDGTAAGTVRLLESGREGPYRLTPAAGRLYFLAPGADGSELWVTDGTAQGTRALTQLQNPIPFDQTGPMTSFGGRIYFVANDVIHGHELWVSDGTVQGTRRVTDFGFFTPFETLFIEDRRLHLGETGGKLIFPATDGLTPKELWLTDGRPESTAPLDSLCPGGCSFSFLRYTSRELVQAGSRVFFVADDGTHGYELWSTDGTAAGTRLTRDICPNHCDPNIALAGELGGKALFYATDASRGPELWVSDGTAAGTRPLTGMPSGRPMSGAVTVGGKHFFVGEDGYGRELWTVSGDGGTRLVADLGAAPPSSEPRELTPVGDRLFFTACDGQDRWVWRSSGTPETTAVVPGPPGECSTDDSPPHSLDAVGNRLVFRQHDANGNRQLWSTDGTDRVQLTHFQDEDFIADSGVLQGRLLFSAHAGGEFALWSSDGTPQGTAKAFALPDLGHAEGFTTLGNELYFRSFGPNGAQPWRTDGTAAGTRKLADSGYPDGFVRAGSFVYFPGYAAPDSYDYALWKTDGTAAGTSRVKVLSNFFEKPIELTAFQDRVYFFAATYTGWQLWRSDGTDAGTYPLRALTFEYSPIEIPRFHPTVFAGRLWFIGADAAHGVELWTSDGTVDGTRPWKDLVPGPASSRPGELAVAAGRLYFTAADDRHGTELWSTDGTDAGTRLEHDLAPQSASSSPHQLTVAGAHLYFIADDGLSGDEVWAFPLSGGGCQPTASRLCLNGGRYQVEAAWRDFQGNRGAGQATALTADTGYFWFFDPSNVEVVLKVLDGRGTNGHVWVFYGALSSVEYTLTVTDTQTGLTRRYFNPSGQLSSVGDTTGFGPEGAYSTAPGDVTVAPASPLALIWGRTDKAATAPCQATATRLCLQGGRFAVEAAWKDFQNRTGAGQATPLTADTGYFWFFGPENLEVMIKVLDGTALNGKHWVFYGALSNVEYRLTVTDTQTGQVKVYENPSGRFASVADTGAF